MNIACVVPDELWARILKCVKLYQGSIPIKINHCIIHRQSLASKDMSPKNSNVMHLVISTVNYMKASDFACLSSCGSVNTLIITYCSCTLLSVGFHKEKLVFHLCRELAIFLKDKEHKNACYFRDPHFIARLVFLNDKFEHVHKLNTELQGKDKCVFDLQSVVKAFVSKLYILREEAEANSYFHLHYYMELAPTLDIDFQEGPDLV